MTTADLKARYHQLLGAYIAKTTDIESRVDQVVATFFNVDSRLHFPFQWWVMGRLDFGMKLEVLDRIIELLEEKDKFKPMMKALRAMMETRNDLAHGHYMPIIKVDEGVRTETKLLARSHRKSKFRSATSFKELDLDTVEAGLATLGTLQVPITELFSMAFQLWPYFSTKDGETTQVPGNFAEKIEKKSDEPPET